MNSSTQAMCLRIIRPLVARRALLPTWTVFVLALPGIAAPPAGTQESEWDEQALARLQSPPLGLPPPPALEENPATIPKIALGRKLFFDRRLSINNTMSCGMCHIPEHGFANNELSTPIGVGGRSLRRNAPTILNTAYVRLAFLDGREPSLEAQATRPLLASDEMGNRSGEDLIERIAALDDYAGLFERAFGSGPSMENIGRAIASWERTLLAANAPFDRWRYGGEADALSAGQKEGFSLFVGKAGCTRCHSVGEESALFTDHSFHDTGVGHRRREVARGESPVPVELAPGIVVPVERDVLRSIGNPKPADLGRFEVTGAREDKWRFRTPSLRNVAVTAPYMHDGSLPTLEAVVEFYDRGGSPHPGLDPLIEPLGLSRGESASLVEFLGSLTSDDLPLLTADARSVPPGN